MATKSTAVKLTLKITSFILRLFLNIVFYILIVIAIINVSKAAYKFTYQLYGPETVDEAPGREIILQIKVGESSMDVASKLEINRVIENKYSFYMKTKLSSYVIMPGTYKINSSMTEFGSLFIISSSASTNSGDIKTAIIYFAKFFIPELSLPPNVYILG